MNIRLFIVMSKADRARFIFQADRDYFAKPIEVHPVRSILGTRHLIVRDPVRNCEFPTIAAKLKTWFQLTNRQRAELGAGGLI